MLGLRTRIDQRLSTSTREDGFILALFQSHQTHIGRVFRNSLDTLKRRVWNLRPAVRIALVVWDQLLLSRCYVYPPGRNLVRTLLWD